MPTTSMVRQSVGLTSYARLREQVKQTLLFGQQRIEQEKVRTYWETGKVINHYLSKYYKGREDRYGEEVVTHLAKDLEVSDTVLRRCMRFAHTFKIQARGPESFSRHLTWSHYRTLITVGDEQKRKQLANRATKFDWKAEDLREEIKKLNRKKSFELLTPKRGTPYTYLLIHHEIVHTTKSGLRLDLGFANYKDALMKGAAGLKAGDIVKSEWIEGDSYRLVKAPDKTEADLFTFYAYVERIVDGDTLRAQVDQGFGVWTRQYLRLRGIDAPELDTNEGKRAKRCIESELKDVPYVIITSTRSDKYDRYLADVFYKSKSGNHFLNNRLLESRFAVHV